jgi:hypothetical protein
MPKEENVDNCGFKPRLLQTLLLNFNKTDNFKDMFLLVGIGLFISPKFYKIDAEYRSKETNRRRNKNFMETIA